MKQIFLPFILLLTILGGCKSHKGLSTSGNNSGGQPAIPTADNPFIQTIQLPVFIPMAEMQNQLYRIFFAPNHGKFYPCPGKDCDETYRDLYIENPDITIDDNIISLKAHLAGTTKVLIFRPGISADIQLSATPEVKDDTLFFRNVKMNQASGDLLLSLTSAFFKKEIEQKIEDKTWYCFRPILDSMTKQAQKQLPLKWYSATLMLNPKKVYLNKVTVLSNPVPGILAYFSADIVFDETMYGH